MDITPYLDLRIAPRAIFDSSYVKRTGPCTMVDPINVGSAR